MRCPKCEGVGFVFSKLIEVGQLPDGGTLWDTRLTQCRECGTSGKVSLLARAKDREGGSARAVLAALKRTNGGE